jgi:glycosyltransferase involved in cell wall biosynthesis
VSLRILHVLASPHLGGAETMCLNLAKAHLAMELDIAVYFFAEGAASEAAIAQGIPILCEVAKPQTRGLMARNLSAAVQDFKPDIVHSHVPISNLICSRTIRNVPWVATIHGSWKQFAYAPQTVQKPYLKPYLLLRHAVGDFWTTRRAARVIAISDYVKKELRKIGVPAEKIIRIHNGVPRLPTPVLRETARKHFAVTEGQLIIGSLGHMAPVKGFDLLIRAFAELAPQYPQLMLWIAGGDVMGDMSVRHSLQELANRHALGSRIRIMDALDQRDEFLAALDLFVVASRTEGFSLVLAEAMQYGKPSVVTSAGGCSEVARSEQEALVFESGNVHNLAKNIERLVTNSDLRATLGSASFERANSYLSLQRCAEEYLAAYESVSRSRA